MGLARGVFGAASPGQRLQLGFERGGVSVGSGATHVPLGLHAIGYGAAISAAGEVAPRANGNGVVYERAGLREWYANGSCTARMRSTRDDRCCFACRELTLKSSGHTT